MSFIIQPQRRALEEVFTRFDLLIRPGYQFYLASEEVNLLGISIGAGTCSDLHGLNIAVLSKEPFNPTVNRVKNLPVNCSGAVLIRRMSIEEEGDKKKSNWYINQPIFVTEGLRLVDQDRFLRKLFFELNGLKTYYVHLE